MTAPATSVRTAVVTALPEELGPIVARARVDRVLEAGRLRARLGTLGGAPVVLAHTGDGRRNAEAGLRELLGAVPVERVLVAGVSGGLSPGLDPGTLVVAREVLDRGRVVPAPDGGWVERALAGGGARGATILSADRIAWDPGEKAAALAGLGGANGPAVVDLESAAFARVASERGVAYLVVRAVCDPAESKLPFDLNVCLDEQGAIRRMRVARYALLHPAVIGPLWELRRQVERCSRRLAEFCETLLAGEEPATAGAAGAAMEARR